MVMWTILCLIWACQAWFGSSGPKIVGIWCHSNQFAVGISIFFKALMNAQDLLIFPFFQSQKLPGFGSIDLRPFADEAVVGGSKVEFPLLLLSTSRCRIWSKHLKCRHCKRSVLERFGAKLFFSKEFSESRALLDNTSSRSSYRMT